MISEKLQKAINEQITAEMWSSNLYLAMSFYFEKEGFSGFAHWMKKQSQEEMGHAYAMADYIIKRGGTAIVDKIDVVPNGWGTPLEVFEHVYKHECHVSALVDKLVDVAAAEKDPGQPRAHWGLWRAGPQWGPAGGGGVSHLGGGFGLCSGAADFQPVQRNAHRRGAEAHPSRPGAGSPVVGGASKGLRLFQNGCALEQSTPGKPRRFVPNRGPYIQTSSRRTAPR